MSTSFFTGFIEVLDTQFNGKFQSGSGLSTTTTTKKKKAAVKGALKTVARNSRKSGRQMFPWEASEIQ